VIVWPLYLNLCDFPGPVGAKNSSKLSFLGVSISFNDVPGYFLSSPPLKNFLLGSLSLS
jgi:hypothetical protein